MTDELFDLVDDILENGEDIPAKVSNRSIMAAVRKGYHVSKDNKKAIKGLDEKVDENHTVAMQNFTGDPGDPKDVGVFGRLNILEAFKANASRVLWLLVGAIVTGIIGLIITGLK